MKKKILFLCSKSSARSHMAAGFASEICPDGYDISCAGIELADHIDERAIEVMSDVGIDIAAHPMKLFSEFDPRDIDLVITLCRDAARDCSMKLPGHPMQVNWNIDDPCEAINNGGDPIREFSRVRDKIRQLVEDLFYRGYIEAMLWASERASLILDSFTEGVIAHDMNRKIVYFNGAAETITGYFREEVLGRDCHDVFPGNFCGSKCSFCDECKPSDSFDSTRYQIEHFTKTGERKLLEVSVQAIKTKEGKMLGILATFRDLTRERDMERRLGEMQSFSGIIGRDKKMLEVFDLIRSVASSNVPVLISGSSGTGKELVAAAIHNEGNHADSLFVPVNCGALPEGLLESELFGHVRGAFTGAIRDKKGRFELADGGTIFLDEIGDISPAMQVKLLRVLQEGTFERVGDTRTQHVNIRVISATNKNLKEEIAAGRFREDLYYRLCVVPIELPPLRERCGDIPLLVDHILKRIADDNGVKQVVLSPSAMDALLSYDWPGNIRELQNALQFSLVKSRGGMIEVAHLPPHIVESIHLGFSPIVAPVKRRGKLSSGSVDEAMRQTGNNKAKAARLLGVGRATLYRFLRTRENPEDFE